MKLYKRQIKPMRHDLYSAMGFTNYPTSIVDKWFDESEEGHLREKYSHCLSDTERLEFKERYIPWIDDIEQAIDVAEEEVKDECCTKEEYSAINYFVYVLKKFLKLEGNMSEEIKNAYRPTEKIKEEIK